MSTPAPLRPRSPRRRRTRSPLRSSSRGSPQDVGVRIRGMDNLQRERAEMHRQLRGPGKRPAASIAITRRTFLHRSLATGVAACGWLPLINTVHLAHAEQSFTFAWVSDTPLYPKDVNSRFVDKAMRALKEV